MLLHIDFHAFGFVVLGCCAELIKYLSYCGRLSWIPALIKMTSSKGC